MATRLGRHYLTLQEGGQVNLGVVNALTVLAGSVEVPFRFGGEKAGRLLQDAADVLAVQDLVEISGLREGFGHSLLDDDLANFLAIWKLDETTGPALDSKGTAHLETDGTPTFNETGKNGKGITCATGCVSLTPDVAPETPMPSHSINIWVKHNAAPAGGAIFPVWGDIEMGLLVPNVRSYFIDVTGTCTYRLQYGITGTYGANLALDIFDGQWHMLTSTTKYGPGNYTYTHSYLDGVMFASNKLSNQYGIMFAAVYPLMRLMLGGGVFTGASLYWPGTIDEILLYTGAISPVQVRTLYKSGQGRFYGTI